ncbi:MAG TPA: Gfo/Idh/MocA family oxidoreductase [Planctomycetes bacterium]|nr:Gfo/Idh/MocA family oxidoreductase [Planctomycetota bacterium]
MPVHRRRFLALSAGSLAAGLFGPHVVSGDTASGAPVRSKNDRPGIGAIGMRYQGTVITLKAQAHGDVVAIADVDRHVREQARASFGSTPKIFEDYRALLDRKDVDVVMIGAPDHWHAKMVIDACRAGKDVYVEKPLTLTVDEGKVIRRVAQETGRVIQVGSWQRSDARYRLAVEMVRAGRLGRLVRVTCTTGPNPSGGPFPVRPVPGHLNWDLWLGQAPKVPYVEQRCHYTFRWWYEYAGGKITDWGAHDIDIAQWAIGELPMEVDARGKLPEIPNGYNVPLGFRGVVRYPSGVELVVKEEGRTGVLFEGTEGRMFVNRGTIAGAPVDRLKEDPLPRDQFQLYDFDNLDRPERVGKLDAIVNHMGNFFDCVRAHRLPISDYESQHRSATTCHLVNLSIRLGRVLKWDAEKEQFIGDADADQWLGREQRKGFEVV